MADEMKYKVGTGERREQIETERKNMHNSARDLSDFFEGFIKKNKLIRTRDFGHDFVVSMHPCSMEDLIEAELLIKGDNMQIPVDTLVRLRSAAILSKAIVSIAGLEIEIDDDTQKTRYRKYALYDQLLHLPPELLKQMYEFYLEIVEEQNQYYSSGDELKNNIENF